MSIKDLDILRHILRYCEQIQETQEEFESSKTKFIGSSIFHNMINNKERIAVKAIDGYLEDGCFTPFKPIKLPKRVQAILVFEERIVDASLNDKSRRQAEAMRRFREEVRSNNEPVPEFEKIIFREIDI